MKLVLQVTAAILIAASVIGAATYGVLYLIPQQAKQQAEEAFFEGVEIDCDKRYTVKRVEAERLRRCQ